MMETNRSPSGLLRLGKIIACFFLSSVTWAFVLTIAIFFAVFMTSLMEGDVFYPQSIPWNNLQTPFKFGAYLFVINCLAELLVFTVWFVVRRLRGKKRDVLLYPLRVLAIQAGIIIRFFEAVDRWLRLNEF